MTGGAQRDLSKVRGWLLLFAVALVPHTVWSVVFLTNSEFFAVVAAEPSRLVNVVTQLVGGLSGLVLIMTRSRFAPAFFTLYFPFGLVVFLMDPDPAATRVAYAEVLVNLVWGNPDLVVAEIESAVAEIESSYALALTVGFTSMALALGYMLRSKRVKAVFGSTGLGVFRKNTGGQTTGDS